ncbi:hypothetical protein, partial [Pleomorphochaeta sp. DL1XJH-081]|uniref:hypothetical protein n=1 Tax=Pleomorphochaeta sp. DL1XJH-081 TaxID=3409690 RepID=UPI003BB6231D
WSSFCSYFQWLYCEMAVLSTVVKDVFSLSSELMLVIMVVDFFPLQILQLGCATYMSGFRGNVTLTLR